MPGRYRNIMAVLPLLAVAALPQFCRCDEVLDAATRDANHPRMLFSAEDVPDLRANAGKGELTPKALAALMTDADSFAGISTDKYVFHAAVAGRAFTKQVLTLAIAGYLTGEQPYIDKAVAVLCAVADQSSPESFSKLNGALAVGDAAHGYAVGYDWLAPFLSPEQRELIRLELQGYGEWLYTHSQTDFWGQDEERRMAHNWNGVTHGALGLVALALGDQPAWLSRAVDRVRAYLKHSHDETGAGFEGVTYLGYGLQNTVPFAVALARQGGPDLIDEAPAVRQIPDYILWQVLPWGGGIMPINQSGGTLQPAGGVLHLISRYRDRVGLWGWLRLFGPEGDGTYGGSSWLGNGCTLPYVMLWADPALEPLSPGEAGLPGSRVFARGQVSLRDGWGDLDSLVTFTSGKGIPGVWNHGDENTFSLCSRGEAFAVDPGGGWGKTSEHNAVLVDGIGQSSDGGPAAVQGRLLAADDRGESVYIEGDATEAYFRTQPLHHALRQLLFVRAGQPYLLIADDIRKDDLEHEYSWLLYSGEGNKITIDGDANTARIIGSRRGAVCDVMFLSPDRQLTMESSLARDKLPVLTAKTRAINPRFLVLLVASEAGQQAPEVVTSRTGADMSVELRFEDGTRDVLTVSPQNISLSRRR